MDLLRINQGRKCSIALSGCNSDADPVNPSEEKQLPAYRIEETVLLRFYHRLLCHV